jgi:hypothetical protein
MSIKDFSASKLIEAAYYLQNKNHETNYLQLLKLIFFADRYHTRSYGVPLTFDTYFAMKFGPLASSSDNIFTQNEIFLKLQTSMDYRLIKEAIIKVNDENCTIKPQEDFYLSRSDKIALDFSSEVFGGFDRFVTADITHDYPEWKRFRENIESGRVKREKMFLIDSFDDPDLSDSPYISRYLGGNDPFKEDPVIIRGIKEAYQMFA